MLPRGEGLAGRFRAVEHLGGDGGGILDQFLGIFASDAVDGTGNGGTQTGNDVFL
jgi:hypothetical protein